MGSIEEDLTKGTERFSVQNLVQQWHSQPRKLRIIHIGAGATGLCCAYKMERQLADYELVCYEKNPEVGGTWYENRYPGCCCDVPSHSYTYTFEPNPNWPAYYSSWDEILKYFKGFHDKYNLSKYIKLNHKVLGAEWRTHLGQWEVEIEHDGQKFTDWCNILVNGSGLLNKWKWPEIEGLHSFEGPVLHSAAWDDKIELAGKRLAVLGTGSSAIQIIPEVQKVADKLKCFMRSSTWISAPMPRVEIDTNANNASKAAVEVKNRKVDEINAHLTVNLEEATNGAPAADTEVHLDPVTEATVTEARSSKQVEPHTDSKDKVEVTQKSNGGGPLDKDIKQYFYKPHEIKKLSEDPDYHLEYRKKIEFGMNAGFRIFYKNSEDSLMAQNYMAAEMARRLNYDPELTKRLIPTWPVGCRRLTPGDGYLEALIQPNVEPIYSDIESIDKNGLITEDGVHHDVDVIICATGFDIAWTPHFKLKGINGVSIHDVWKDVPNCYLGLGAPGFPNYFIMNGPRGNLCNGTVISCFETQLEYMIEAAKKMQRDRILSMDIKEDVTTSLQRYIDNWHEGGVWSGECKSWYKNNTKGGKIMCWGGSSMHYLKSIRYPRWEHWNINYMDKNPWGFLGNGRSKGEVLNDFEMMVPYIRNTDTPWNIE